MAKILLTSTGFFHQKVRAQFNKLITNKKSAVIITTASPKKELNQIKMPIRIDLEGMGFERVTFLDVENESIDSLRDADVIYISGGNPFVLLHHLRESGADRLLQKKVNEDCIIVGVSAGAVVLGSSIRIVEWFSPALNTIDLKDFTGIQLFDFSLLPHADRKDLFPFTDSIEDRMIAFEKASGEQVYRLSDDEFKLI